MDQKQHFEDVATGKIACPLVDIGREGRTGECVFFPFFRMWLSEHDSQKVQSMDRFTDLVGDMTKKTDELFKLVKGGSGEPGLQVKVARLETKLGIYIVVGSALTSFLIQFLLKVSGGF